MTLPTGSDVERFRAVVGERLGLFVEEDRVDGLAVVLRDRLDKTGDPSVDAYLARLLRGSRDELRALAEQLTVTETYFFRCREQFEALAETVLPEVLAARRTAKTLRILSAGCASGEEPYSIAILLKERVPELAGWDVKVHAIDVNRAALERAASARYGAWSLRATPIGLTDAYLEAGRRELVLREPIRAMVSFEERNLIDEDETFWRPDAFDVVFCRNVTMYFVPDVARRVVARIARALSPGGYLFLGHAETLRGVSRDFELRHSHDTFYYRRRGVLGAPEAVGRPSIVALEGKDSQAACSSLDDLSWVGLIQGASDRIARLADNRRSANDGEVSCVSVAGGHGRVDLEPALELLRRERFADALAMMQTLPAQSLASPDAAILRAVLLANGGRLSEAERVCRQILALDDMNAGAHYLLALCRDGAGDRHGAVDHDRLATHLDAGFVMPRIHLGVLARRAGDLDVARVELAHAIDLIAAEDPARILLFGGGFSREVLVELCRSELRLCGGAS
jgi:chemotaxis protein methyltransferase CheR